MDMDGVAMARNGPILSQDGATDHINLLEAYLALYKPSGTNKNKGFDPPQQKTNKPRPTKTTNFIWLVEERYQAERPYSYTHLTPPTNNKP